MNKYNLKVLAAVAVLLVAILIALQFGGQESGTNGKLLYPDLKSKINNITSLTVTRAGPENPVEIRKDADSWVVASRDNYPLDIAKLRQLLLQIADAKIVERKTSNPDLYAQLGVQDPAIEGSTGVRLKLSGDDVDYDLIIGSVAQGSFRYVRVADEAQSWLIDRNADIPDTPGAWLVRNIVDIKSADIHSASISHPDGEEIRISKESVDATDFDVANIPEGRELSYATVANGIAGVLNALTLDDVRKGDAFDATATSTTFETFDGTRIVVRTEKTGDNSWITLQAFATGDAADASDSVASINARVSGWQFKIPDYKASQLTRRWKDLLKAEDG